jgi:hypothetical protein
MIIELYGFSGSGKTYASSRIAKERGVELVEVSRFGMLYVYFVAFVLLHPVIFWRFFAIFVKENFPLGLRLFLHKLRLLIVMFAKEQKARFAGGGLVDEGIFMFLQTVFERPMEEADLRKLDFILSSADYQVYVFNRPYELCEKRIVERGRRPRQAFGEAYVEKWWPTFQRNHGVIDEFIRENYSVVEV